MINWFECLFFAGCDNLYNWQNLYGTEREKSEIILQERKKWSSIENLYYIIKIEI